MEHYKNVASDGIEFKNSKLTNYSFIINVPLQCSRMHNFLVNKNFLENSCKLLW